MIPVGLAMFAIDFIEFFQIIILFVTIIVVYDIIIL